ncbi:hypothetical protein LL127_19010 [Clostridium estertheticum]|uniref:hypothetical protein n=1 Tax=Clostridium estertheticum TaxID=238834 RepID=UPI001CF17460|nr:hypothetical protein [Clostridium estertheticum]MCB2308634.1 hypothetical protein [Clostridium estertheticum]MCB2344599.1 hypothetical protein [Clostridium estertheticum]WAG45585.1 hypothetical protein LL127_19010 [Clostridium estertheticum]
MKSFIFAASAVYKEIRAKELAAILKGLDTMVAKTICSRVCMNIYELKEMNNSNYKMGLSCGLSQYNFNSKYQLVN